MRIGHLIRSLDPAAGGPPVACIKLASTQSTLSHQVSIATEWQPEIINLDPSIRVQSYFRTGIRDRLRPGKLIQLLTPWVAEQEVLHLHGVWDTFLHVASHLARRLKVPYVVMPHGMLDPWSMAQKAWKKRIAMILGTRNFLREAAAIHLLHEEEGQYLRNLGVNVRGFVIANGVTLSEIDPITTEHGVPGLGSQPYILFLGRVHFKKGLDYLADAFAKIAHEFPDCHLVVAGPDDGEVAPFQSRIQQHRLETRTHLTGPIYGRQKWALLAGARLFCLPSRQEGFSVAILEALATRTPVVISDQCHFPEVASTDSGIVVRLDADEIAKAFRQILSNENLRFTMGQNGRMLIEKQYTWESVARSTINMYEQLVPMRTRSESC